MRRIRDRVAGLDVHRDWVVACARVADGEQLSVDKERFKTTTRGVAALAVWLAEREVTSVVMEATGVYWKPVFYGLEGRFAEVWLVNAQHVKNVPGRKTDMADAEWLADVAAHGMVRPSLVPPEPIRELRELTRYRKTQTDERAREIQRLDKVLQDAGIKLSSVASRVMTKSGRAMIEALIAGERDPKALAELSLGRMRAKRTELAEALEGRFRAPHATVARQVLDHIDFLDRSTTRLDETIGELIAPFAEEIGLLVTMVGWDRLTAEVFIAETGGDMTRFPSAAHLASWARLCPGNHESAGRRRAVGKQPGNPWLARALIQAARAAGRSKNTYFAAQYARIARRRGPNKAAVAVAHSMTVAAWHMLTNSEPYHDPGGDYFDKRRDPRREIDQLVRRLHHHGYRVTLEPVA